MCTNLYIVWLLEPVFLICNHPHSLFISCNLLLKQVIYIPQLVAPFPGKDSSMAVVDVEAEVKDAD